MALDLNQAPPDDEHDLPDLNNPHDDEAHYDLDGAGLGGGQQLISPGNLS